MQSEGQLTNTEAEAKLIGMPVLRINTQGEAVRFLQQYLIAYGYLNKEILTGKFCAETEQSVKDFQSIYGLVIDGVVGKETWEKMGDII